MPADLLQQLGLSRSDQPGKSDDLASAQVEIDQRAVGPGPHASGLDRDLVAVAALVPGREDELSEDRRGDRALVHGGVVLRYDPPVPQHDRAVAQPVHFAHPVRDVEDGDSAPLQVADRFEQLFRLPFGQGGGRLVEDQQLGLLRQFPGDGHFLAPAWGKVLHRRVQRQAELQLLLDGAGAPHDFAPVQENPVSGLRHFVEQQVFGDGHSEDYAVVDVLVDRRDSGVPRVVGVAELAFLPVDNDSPDDGLVDAGEYLDERRLARAVRAEQAERFARPDIEADASKSPRGAERLHNSLELDQRPRQAIRRRTGAVGGCHVLRIRAYCRLSIHGATARPGVASPGKLAPSCSTFCMPLSRSSSWVITSGGICRSFPS